MQTGITIQLENECIRTHKAVFLDMTVDAPARCLWMSMKQFNGYYGCGKCKEPGQRFELINENKKNKSGCHIYPFNTKMASSTGHAAERLHEEVREHGKKALKNSENGITKVSLFSLL